MSELRTVGVLLCAVHFTKLMTDMKFRRQIFDAPMEDRMSTSDKFTFHSTMIVGLISGFMCLHDVLRHIGRNYFGYHSYRRNTSYLFLPDDEKMTEENEIPKILALIC